MGIWPQSRGRLRTNPVLVFLPGLRFVYRHIQHSDPILSEYSFHWASGAIFGVVGAYLMLSPNGRIRTLFVLWKIPVFPKLRAAWVILYFLAVQLIPAATAAIWGTTTSSTNNWAHLGGFLGCLSIFFFMRPDAFARLRNRELI